MVPGIFARTYASRDPDTVLAQVRRDGFEAVQFNLSCAGLDPLPAEMPAGTGEAVLAAARIHGVALSALSGTYNMAHPDPERRRSDRARFANVLRAACAMEIGLVTLCTGSRDEANMWKAHPGNATPEAWADLRSEMDAVLKMAGPYNIFLGIEPEPGNVIANAPLARRLLDEVGNPALGIVLDAANLLPPEALVRQREVVAEAVDLLGSDLVLVHAKDVTADGKVVPAGLGAIDLPSFVARVRSSGYEGPLIGHGFEEADAPAVATYLKSLTGGVLGTQA